MGMDFNLKIFGKCIIAGEHAVIRGSPAIVLPVKEKYLEIFYKKTTDELKVEFEGHMKEDLSLVFFGVLEKALNVLRKKHSDLVGELKLVNTVPVGAGLGASATLCVAIGRLLQHFGWVSEEHLYEFCRQLENLFHGESSGVDIASTLMGRPIEFQRPSQITELKIKWQPKLYISYCGQRGMTSECVRLVKDFSFTNEKEAVKIDHDMRESVALAKKSLMSEEKDGLVDLIESINKARSCFERWGLTAGALDQHMKKLTEEGALAVKPTGSGRGGYVISLWRSEPKTTFDLIPLKF
jgi:mevalonate kinase